MGEVDKDPFDKFEGQAGSDVSELERTLVLVPNNTTDRLIATRIYLKSHKSFVVYRGGYKPDGPNEVEARCDEVFDQMDAHKQAEIDVFDAIKRIILFEVGVHTFELINEVLGQEYLRQMFESNSGYCSKFGVDPRKLSQGDLHQLEQFKKRVWKVSTQQEFKRAHQLITVFYNHIKPHDKVQVFGRMGGGYVHSISKLLDDIFLDNEKIVSSAGIGFGNFYMRYFISDHFKFKDPPERIEEVSSKAFNPVTLYIKLKSIATLYAQNILGTLEKKYITSDPTSVTLPSGMTIEQVASTTRFE